MGTNSRKTNIFPTLFAEQYADIGPVAFFYPRTETKATKNQNYGLDFVPRQVSETTIKLKTRPHPRVVQ